ncbi:MAG: Mrp/NBP35 family ATP-binding protein [Dehalococcoidales bacterium]|nr:Mrp/NBP35 family ATP-binding protein [Dehalococcoidales bacterium]MDZ4230716.1 Mrp/NBP35 family ATP-binding protein [Dehalococcoidales bacterium]
MSKKYGDIAGDGGSDIIGQVTAQGERLRSRMAFIRHKVAVMSGKGGVGKSALTINLAAILASQGYRVGVLDADINGPAVAKMLGVRMQSLPTGESGIAPASGPLNIKVMSMDLILPGEKTPVVWDAPTQRDTFIWRGTIEAGALREFLADTVWGELDFLLIDLPPGPYSFSTVAQLIPEMIGIMVTIPSEVAYLIVRKFTVLAQELKTPLVGLVENMVGYVCPHCGKLGDLFYAAGNGERMAAELGLPHLGGIPFDPRLQVSTDWGVPFVLEHGDSPAGKALSHIADKVKLFLGEGLG